MLIEQGTGMFVKKYDVDQVGESCGDLRKTTAMKLDLDFHWRTARSRNDQGLDTQAIDDLGQIVDNQNDVDGQEVQKVNVVVENKPE